MLEQFLGLIYQIYQDLIKNRLFGLTFFCVFCMFSSNTVQEKSELCKDNNNNNNLFMRAEMDHLKMAHCVVTKSSTLNSQWHRDTQ